jgi:hypothetical protein
MGLAAAGQGLPEGLLAPVPGVCAEPTTCKDNVCGRHFRTIFKCANACVLLDDIERVRFYICASVREQCMYWACSVTGAVSCREPVDCQAVAKA